MVGTTVDVPLASNLCPCVPLSIPLSFHDITDLPPSPYLQTGSDQILEVAKAWE